MCTLLLNGRKSCYSTLLSNSSFILILLPEVELSWLVVSVERFESLLPSYFFLSCSTWPGFPLLQIIHLSIMVKHVKIKGWRTSNFENYHHPFVVCHYDHPFVIRQQRDEMQVSLRIIITHLFVIHLLPTRTGQPPWAVRGSFRPLVLRFTWWLDGSIYTFKVW